MLSVSRRCDFPLLRYRRLKSDIIFLMFHYVFLSRVIGPLARTRHWPTPRQSPVRWSVTTAESAVVYYLLLLLPSALFTSAEKVGHALPGHSATPYIRCSTFKPHISATNWDIDFEQNLLSTAFLPLLPKCFYVIKSAILPFDFSI